MNYLERDSFGIYKSTSAHGPGPTLMGAHTLTGNDVYYGADTKLGDIKEIMLDMRSGRVAYAVMSFGGVFGMGEKLFAIPWRALTLDTDNKRFTLNVDRAKFEDAPGFDANHWPDMADATWEKSIHTYYGVTPYSDGQI